MNILSPIRIHEPKKITSGDIHEALKKSFATSGWVYIKELRAGTGYSSEADRYIDAWLMQTFPSSPMRILAVEIKVERSDFRKEVKHTIKRDSALRISNEFYFAAPSGLIHKDEVPAECGLIEVSDSCAKIVINAPFREVQITLPFLASLARRVQ
jgi:hypothetical protein